MIFIYLGGKLAVGVVKVKGPDSDSQNQTDSDSQNVMVERVGGLLHTTTIR